MTVTTIRTCRLTLSNCSDAPRRLHGMCAPFVLCFTNKTRTEIYTESASRTAHRPRRIVDCDRPENSVHSWNMFRDDVKSRFVTDMRDDAHDVGHHAFDARAVLGSVQGSSLRFDRACARPSGLDAASAQLVDRQLRDGRSYEAAQFGRLGIDLISRAALFSSWSATESLLARCSRIEHAPSSSPLTPRTAPVQREVGSR